MRYHFFLHYGWFFQNLGKEGWRTFMHTTVGRSSFTWFHIGFVVKYLVWVGRSMTQKYLTSYVNASLGEMNSNLKSVDVNVPGQWLTKAKKEWSKGWPNLESWNFSVQIHALLSSILPSSSKLQRLRRFQSFLNGWGNSFSSNQTRYIFLVVYERKLLEALVHFSLFFWENLSSLLGLI